MTATIATVSAALVAAATSVDKVLAKVEGTKQAWAVFCAERLVGDKPSLTMDEVAAALVAAVAATPAGRKAKVETVTDLVKKGFSTLGGWYYDLNRVHKAGLTSNLLAPNAQALTTLRRGVDPTQPKAPRKGKPVASEAAPVAAPEPVAPVAAAPVAGTMTLKDVAAFMVQARKELSVKALCAAEQHLSVILNEAANMGRSIEAARKAQREAAAAKAAAPKRTRQRKAA